MGYLNNEGLAHFWEQIKSTLSRKQDKLTGAQGQVVGFDEKGNAVAQDAQNSTDCIKIGQNEFYDLEQLVVESHCYPDDEHYGCLEVGAGGAGFSCCARSGDMGVYAGPDAVSMNFDSPEQDVTSSIKLEGGNVSIETSTPEFGSGIRMENVGTEIWSTREVSIRNLGAETNVSEDFANIAGLAKNGSRFLADVLKSMAEAATPRGVIVMWSGAVTAIPTGWALCDGSNGTPDLRNRFVVGAGDTYPVGATGGEATHTLTVNEMPFHEHPMRGDTYYQYLYNNEGNFPLYIHDDNPPRNVETDTAGGGQPHNNMPPYYALCYIMKL